MKFVSATTRESWHEELRYVRRVRPNARERLGEVDTVIVWSASAQTPLRQPKRP